MIVASRLSRGSAESGLPLMQIVDAPATGETAGVLGHGDESGFRLTAIVRKRRLPLLLVIDEAGALLSSSLPDDAPPAAQRLLDQAVSEARRLSQCQLETRDITGTNGLDETPRQRCTLVMIGSAFFSVRLFPLHAAALERRRGQYAALIEPIAESSVDGIDLAKLKAAYRLSKREMDVLEALMSGSTDKQIAQALGVRSGTVRAYLKSVRAKLKVTTRAAVVHLAHQASSDGWTDNNT